MTRPCRVCGDPAPGQVWVRVDIDHELPGPCPVCHGDGFIETPHHEPALNQTPAYAMRRAERLERRQRHNALYIGLLRGRL